MNIYYVLPDAASGVCSPYCCTAPRSQKGSALVLMFCSYRLKFSISFEQGIPYFNFTLGLRNVMLGTGNIAGNNKDIVCFLTSFTEIIKMVCS